MYHVSFQVSGLSRDNEMQETTEMTALQGLSITPETSTSPSIRPSEAAAMLEHGPSQEDNFPAVPSASPPTTQASLSTGSAEEPHLPPESGEYQLVLLSLLPSSSTLSRRACGVKSSLDIT